MQAFFNDLGPIREYDERIEEQDDTIYSQIVVYDRESIKVEQRNDKDLFEGIQGSFNIELQETMETTYNKYNELITIATELTSLFGLQDMFTLKTTQLTKLCLIGQMQIQSVIENLSKDYSHIIGDFCLYSKDINLNYVYQILSILNINLLPKILNVCEEFFIKNHTRKPKHILIELHYNLSKFLCVLEAFPHACASQDIKYEYKNNIIVKEIAKKEQIDHAYKFILSAIQSAQAMMQKKSETETKIFRGIIHNLGPIYYMLARKQGLLKAHQLMAEPTVELAFAVWNMGETGLAKHLMPIIFPSIKYKQCIYIPRYFKQINLEYVKYYQKHYMGIITPPQPLIDKSPKLLSFYQLIENGDDRIKIRILNSETLNISPSSSLQNYYQDPLIQISRTSFIDRLFHKKTNTTYENIIIHIHGGGFVSMSSRSHQIYTRLWANSLGVPIFSIDYRLSPQYSFPAALDDCWQAYLWIIHFALHYFNITPKKIILIGDSAGGNLCAALTALCIRESVYLPAGIILAYPALNLDPKNFNMYQFVSLDDGLLPHSFLKLCVKSYIQDETLNYKDSLISPGEAIDEVLQQFPQTYILTGTNDPLHGDTWTLLGRLINLGKKCKLYKYDYMPHGFLNFYNLIPNGEQCINDVTQIIKDIFSQ
ncbi:unnamed protein product [Paramecium primaurelia]|uniref:Alpha/beta hydrolase fold-3 domain-containing protein n=1 Tax=Paramecium primaurelia TaxID=5886 RepID=A0A8S1M970_PARPR|nr:unnamed protein product [Paramecium primaurelia]